MTDRPIIFSAPMVRALLDGRKTQDRRVLRPQPETVPNGFAGARLPYAPGDRLWVREAWRIGAWDWNNAQIAVDYCDGPHKEWLAVDDGDMLHRLIDQSRAAAVKAGLPLRDSYYEYSWAPGRSPCRWRSPIHMPRWASRLTLLVTDVRVQRLQEISSADAIAEGCPPYANSATIDCDTPNPRDDFKRLWNSIHGSDAWDANQWVAAISFTVHRCNIDTMEEGTW